MASVLRNILFSICTVLGTGSSAAALGTSIKIDQRGDNYVSIQKKQLMNGVKFNLSSLTNIDDALSLSLKDDMIMALSKNYSELNLDDLEMNFYYGNSINNPKIDFVNDSFSSIMYFTVSFHSKNNKFRDSSITFDYRPHLKEWRKDSSRNGTANMWISKPVSEYNSLGEMFLDFNNYLGTSFIRADFLEQWKDMGLIADSLTNSDKIESIMFTKNMISYGNNLKINLDKKNIFSTKIFDEIPDIYKINLFSNLNSSMKIQTSNIYSLNAAAFKNYDKVLTISDSDAKDKKISDYKENLLEVVRSAVANLTNFQIILDENQLNKFNIEFKKSYKDPAGSFEWDTKLSEMKNINYLFVSIKDSGNPLINVLDNTGFGILIN